MEFNISMRKKQLENLNQFISTSEGEIQSVLTTLNWKADEVMKDNGLVVCSIDPCHRVSKSRIEGHMEKCALKGAGYDLKEKFLSEPLHDPNYSIYIDDFKKMEILSNARRMDTYFRAGWNGQDPDPKTSERLTSTFTPDERLALYTHTILSTKRPEQPPEFDITTPKPHTQDLTYEEILTLERNAKRRRIKYRSVHTKKKNYTEVMREVIDGQMRLYEEWLDGNQGKAGSSECGDRRSIRSGGSRSESRKRDSENGRNERSRRSRERGGGGRWERGHRSRDRSEGERYRKRERRERSRSRHRRRYD